MSAHLSSHWRSRSHPTSAMTKRTFALPLQQKSAQLTSSWRTEKNERQARQSQVQLPPILLLRMNRSNASFWTNQGVRTPPAKMEAATLSRHNSTQKSSTSSKREKLSTAKLPVTCRSLREQFITQTSSSITSTRMQTESSTNAIRHFTRSSAWSLGIRIFWGARKWSRTCTRCYKRCDT